MLIGSALVALVSYLIQLALFVLIVVAFLTALMHPRGDFTDTSSKTLWLVILGIGILLGIDRLFFNLIFFIPWILTMIAYWACIFAAIYFLSQEHTRMSRLGGFTWKNFFGRHGRGNGGARNSRGSW